MPTDAFEVVVVDDGSTDNSVEGIRALQVPYPLRTLEQPNRGPGAARNLAARHARGELLVFLDADKIPDPKLLEQYQQENLRNPDAVLIGRELPWPAAFQSRFDQVFNYVREERLGPEPLRAQWYHLVSGNFAIPQAAFDALGGFDESLRMTEDTELGYRAYRAGLRLLYVPAAIGYHNHSKTFRQLCRELQSSAWWTAQIMKKHPEIRGMIPTYRDLEPIDGLDPPRLIARKLARHFLATKPLLKLQETAAFVASDLMQSRRLHQLFCWKILASYRLIGLRDGLRENHPRQA